MAKKTITTSINLPVESISSIIDIDNENVEVKIGNAIKVFDRAGDEEVKVRSMNTISFLHPSYDGMRIPPADAISLTNDVFTINSISRKPVEKTNSIKFVKINLEFATGDKKTFVVPSYVKFYSSHTATFIPVEFLRSRHILMDYAGRAVKVEDAEVVEDFKMTEYYNIKTSYELDEKNVDEDGHQYPCTCNFYLNGVLTNVSYNNFQIKETSEDQAE